MTNENHSSSELIDIQIIDKLLPENHAVDYNVFMKELERVSNVENASTLMNQWIESAMVQKFTYKGKTMLTKRSNDTKPQKKTHVKPKRSFQSPILPPLASKKEEVYKGMDGEIQALNATKQRLKDLLEKLEDDVRRATVLLKNPLEDLEQITEKWKQATQRAIEDYKTKAIELGVTVESLSNKRKWDWEGDEPKDKGQVDEESTPTIRQLLGSLGVYVEQLVDLLDYDEENDEFKR